MLNMTVFYNMRFLGEHYYVTFALCHRKSVCLSVTLLHPNQRIELLGNRPISAPSTSLVTRTVCVQF